MRGTGMISLALITGLCAGCSRPQALPPEASISRLPTPPRASHPVDLAPQIGSLPEPVPLPPPELTPDSVSRQSWKPEAEPRDWKYVVIHHSASDRGDVDSIHAAHLERKWLGIGYHFVIGNGSGMPDGEVEPTFRWREQLHGAHAGSDEHNQNGIGVCLIGNFDEAPPSDAQLAAAKRLVGSLKADYGIAAENVIGHGDIKATACPGKLFPMAEVSHSGTDSFAGRSARSVPVRLARFQRSGK